nr:juvenile hormone acid O-methyltransferase-like [Dermacentor andersoni]XP_054922863.1 juvenile hormone acid O-methyltransferase-like [Dermacentor andersoni]
MPNSMDEQQKQTTSDLEPKPFTWLKEFSYRENLAALYDVQFRRPSSDDDQYLDVGSGPGNFLAEQLLPLLRPFARVVATDISEDMIAYAQNHYPEAKVCFEVLDIENGDVQFIVDKYGLFDRIFSFLTFHYIWDLHKAYRNVSRLLKDGGECLIVYFTRTGITDVWHRIYQNEEWRSHMPDPSLMFSERFCFDKAVDEEKLVALEKSAVTAAGLELVKCRTYSSLWKFATADICLDAYMPFFKLDARVPEEKRAAFWNTWRHALHEASNSNSSGISLNHDVLIAHSQKLPAPI